MAVASLYADAHLAGTWASPENAVGNTPLTWAGALNTNGSYTSRWSMPNPTDPLTAGATQTVRVVAKKGTNSGTPTIAINLYVAGVLVRQILAATSITSLVGQTLTATFTSAEVSDRTGVEIELVEVGAGGSGSARNSAQVSTIEWAADTTAAVSKSGGSSTAVGVTTAGGGRKTGRGGSALVALLVQTLGGGRKTARSGSATAVATVTTGGGAKRASGGSEAAVLVVATGGGERFTLRREGGSATAIGITTEGGGAKSSTGGSPTDIGITATGGGTKQGRGGSSLLLTLAGTGGGSKSTSGGSHAQVLILTTGLSAPPGPTTKAGSAQLTPQRLRHATLTAPAGVLVALDGASGTAVVDDDAAAAILGTGQAGTAVLTTLEGAAL